MELIRNAYDTNANRIEKRTRAVLNRFAYDSVNRLAEVRNADGSVRNRCEYDAFGECTGDSLGFNKKADEMYRIAEEIKQIRPPKEQL